MFSKIWTTKSTNDCLEQMVKLKQVINDATAMVIGAGSGLSTAAGHSYSGERFKQNFGNFISKYHFRDMYSATFYPYDSLEEYWAYMSKHIFLNRYSDMAGDIYSDLLNAVKEKNYFVITTNVDHLFQKAGFDKKRLFYMQGDYGLWQCSVPCHNRTYDNKEMVLRMVREQKDLRIESSLVPYCPKCGNAMSMNLRCDSTFVQDRGWHKAAGKYEDFILKYRKDKILYLELGVGNNTPAIIKYPFWQLTAENPDATYVCVNLNEAECPQEIQKQSICIDADICQVIKNVGV